LPGGNQPGAGGVAGDDPDLGVTGGGAPRGKGSGAAAPKQPAAGAPADTQVREKSERFLTIDPKLRRLIAHTEENISSLILYADMSTTKVPVLVNYLYYLDRIPAARSKDVEMVVFVLPEVKGDPSCRVGLACRNRRDTPSLANEIEKILTRVGKEDLRELFGFEFSVNAPGGDQVAANRPPVGGGGFGVPPGVGVGRGGPPGAPAIGPGGVPGAPAMGPGGGADGGSLGAQGANPGQGTITPPPGFGVPPGVGSQTGGGGKGSFGAGSRGGGIGLEEGGGAIGPGGAAGQQPAAPEHETGGRIKVDRSEEYIVITVSIKSPLAEFTDKHVSDWMAQLRGNQEMASRRFRFGDLAASLDHLKVDLTRQNKKVMFPFGAFPRAYDAERGSRPWPANERVSFLRELLPYLGDDRYFTLAGDIDPEKSWKDPGNVTKGRILVPHFLNPAAGAYGYVRSKGVDQSLAATHFVGMAGVGADAAYYPKTDPRAGIFGYNRQTSPDDVTDGLANTIFMIEVDKAMLGPWIAGGGATVRGTSSSGADIGKRGGFGSPNFGGKPGVWVLMADGSARFLTKDISPEVFKALCTMAGSDSAGAIDLIAAKQNLDVSKRTEAQAASTAPRKRVVEEEEAPVKKQ
jgi:hypothetical protein